MLRLFEMGDLYLIRLAVAAASLVLFFFLPDPLLAQKFDSKGIELMTQHEGAGLLSFSRSHTFD